MTYEVKSGKPIPPIAKIGGRESQYPFGQMKPQDYFEVPIKTKRTVQRVRAAIGANTQRTGRTYTTRTSLPDGVGERVLTVWRTK